METFFAWVRDVQNRAAAAGWQGGSLSARALDIFSIVVAELGDNPGEEEMKAVYQREEPEYWPFLWERLQQPL